MATKKEPKPEPISPLALAEIGHQAHRVYRAARNSEGNIPAFGAIPPEMQNAWAAAAQAIAVAAATGKVEVGPDPEWSKDDRAVLASVLREKRAAVIHEAREKEQAPDGSVLDGLDNCLAKLGAS